MLLYWTFGYALIYNVLFLSTDVNSQTARLPVSMCDADSVCVSVNNCPVYRDMANWRDVAVTCRFGQGIFRRICCPSQQSATGRKKISSINVSDKGNYERAVRGLLERIKYPILLLLLAVCNAESNTKSICSQKETSSSHLDVAVDMIKKAKNNFPSCENCGNLTRNAMDCADILRMGSKKSGVYKIWPINRLTVGKSIEVYCDMETTGGGWTVIQRRGDYHRLKDYFFKDWKSYKEGFGDIEKDFWLGNDNIFALTNQKLYSARFDLEDTENNKRYAQYDTFWIDDENNKYTLHLSDFSGDAGDSMTKHSNNQSFSTKDQDNDEQNHENCAALYKGGWWYRACHLANLNGLYLKGKHESFADGIEWHSWKGYHESLLKTEIKIRPKNFRLSPDSTDSSEMTPTKRKKRFAI